MRRPSGEMSKLLRRGRRATARRACPRTGRARGRWRTSSTCRCGTRPIGSVVVPEAVLRLAGGVAGFLAVLEFLAAPCACALAPFSSGQTQETKAMRLPSGNQREGLDAGGHRRRRAAPRRRRARSRRAAASRPSCPAARAWRRRRCGRRAATRRLAVLVAAVRQRARRAAERRQQPQRAARLLSSIDEACRASTPPARRRATGWAPPRRSSCHRSSTSKVFFLAMRAGPLAARAASARPVELPVAGARAPSAIRRR